MNPGRWRQERGRKKNAIFSAPFFCPPSYPPAVPGPQPTPPPAFPPTRWTLVRAVRAGGMPAEQALAELCTHYWYPIYAFLRRDGHAPADAQDLTQGFFAALLADETFTRAAPERGRLRSFLLGALRQFLAEEHRRATRQKRGGGLAPLPLEFDAGEQRYSAEPPDHRDPETLYHRAWAVSLLADAYRALRGSYAAPGKSEQLAAIEPHLEGDDAAVPYRELAARLHTTETALRLTVFRARQKLRSLIEEEIRRTASDAAEAAEELRWLQTVLKR